ncbi:GTP binding domain protein [Echinococcus multilocularis]|uniref:GTP binding domain protein n=1 Tax=Echinococcus multilocularis TaxID=6211 RepID=A0A068Y592_ECHMU|nr:GTP binding domain protein [Echinococcus multilocularis]
MVMVKSCRKVKSKRITCHKRYKILKKVREHHRKVRKERKKNPKLFKRKDPGIPNSLPFKEQILEHIKGTMKLESERQLALLQHAKKLESSTEKPKKKIANVGFSKQFAHVINKADVVIEVLDARDPLGTRSVDAENEVLAAGKKLVLLLNKIDLVPRGVVQQWLTYFRKWYTIMPFKSNTQEKSNRLRNIKGKIPRNTNPTVKSGLGVDGLMVLLGNICRHNGGNLTVGLVGLPNTGKSAVINTLVCRKVAHSSCVPGLTKQCQLYKVDNKINLIDSPGIVLSKREDPCELVLRNCKKPDSVEAPETAVSAILAWCPKRQIMVHYSIGEYDSTTDFLCKLAHRLGRLRKGGVPDTKGSARALLSDWITGKLAHHTLPPESAAPIAEPSKPAIIAIDETDFPLQEFDDNVLKRLPKANAYNDFCPVAVVGPSTPFRVDFGGSWRATEDILISKGYEANTDAGDDDADDNEYVSADEGVDLTENGNEVMDAE